MKRAQKLGVVQHLEQVFQEAALLVITRPQGLKVAESTELRRKMHEAEAHFQVTKNSLAKRALANTPLKDLCQYFEGPTALGWSSDPLSAAKITVEFANNNPKFVVLAGAMENRILSLQAVQELASLPSKTELQAKLLRLIQTPATQIACTLKEVQAKIVRVLDARASQSQ